MNAHIVFYAIVGIGFAGGFVWLMAFRVRKPHRYNDLTRYRRELLGKDGCENALVIYRDGVHIINFYGIPSQFAGYKDDEEFHAIAVASLERAINILDIEYAKLFRASERGTDIRELNDKILKLRADLVRLKLLRCSSDYRQQIAGKFAL